MKRLALLLGTMLLSVGLAPPAQAGDHRACFSMGEFNHIATMAAGGKGWTRRQVDYFTETHSTRRAVADTEYRIAYAYKGCVIRGRKMRMRVSYNRVTKQIKAMNWTVISGEGLRSHEVALP